MSNDSNKSEILGQWDFTIGEASMKYWSLLITAVDVYDKTSLHGRAFVVLSCYCGWIEQSVFNVCGIA